MRYMQEVGVIVCDSQSVSSTRVLFDLIDALSCLRQNVVDVYLYLLVLLVGLSEFPQRRKLISHHLNHVLAHLPILKLVAQF